MALARACATSHDTGQVVPTELSARAASTAAADFARAERFVTHVESRIIAFVLAAGWALCCGPTRRVTTSAAIASMNRLHTSSAAVSSSSFDTSSTRAFALHSSAMSPSVCYSTRYDLRSKRSVRQVRRLPNVTPRKNQFVIEHAAHPFRRPVVYPVSSFVALALRALTLRWCTTRRGGVQGTLRRA
jgi:hypothetical protein